LKEESQIYIHEVKSYTAAIVVPRALHSEVPASRRASHGVSTRGSRRASQRESTTLATILNSEVPASRQASHGVATPGSAVARIFNSEVPASRRVSQGASGREAESFLAQEIHTLSHAHNNGWHTRSRSVNLARVLLVPVGSGEMQEKEQREGKDKAKEQRKGGGEGVEE